MPQRFGERAVVEPFIVPSAELPPYDNRNDGAYQDQLEHLQCDLRKGNRIVAGRMNRMGYQEADESDCDGKGRQNVGQHIGAAIFVTVIGCQRIRRSEPRQQDRFDPALESTSIGKRSKKACPSRPDVRCI